LIEITWTPSIWCTVTLSVTCSLLGSALNDH